MAERRLPPAAGALGPPALIVVLLGALLLLVPEDRVRYELPELPPFASDRVEQLRLRQPGREVVLNRAASGGWTVSEANGALRANDASAETVAELVAAVAGARFSDLVSRGDGVARYGLDSARRIDIELSAADEVVASVGVGNLARDGGATYVQVPGDRRIYQVSGDLRSAFSLPAANYRDTRVLAFAAAEVTRVDVEGRWPYERDGPTADAGVVAGSLERDNDGGWSVGDEAGAAVEEAVGRAGALSAIRYTDVPPAGEPLMRATFHVGAERHELAIYPDPGNRYTATTSQREDPFFLFNWIAESMLELVGVLASSNGISLPRLSVE